MSKIKSTPMRSPAATAVAEPPKTAAKPATATSPDVPASNLDMSPGDLEKIGAEAEQLARVVENVFCRLADGNDLSDDELATLRRVGPRVVPRDGGRSERAFARWKKIETARIKKIRELQSQAGTGAQRQAAIDVAEKAETTLAARSAEIEAAIAKLQGERAELQSAAAVARDESDHRQAALRRLREKSILPAFAADRLQQAERRWASGDGHRLEVKRNRLKDLESLGKLDVSERKMVPGGYAGGKGLEVVRSYVENCKSFGSTPDERLRSMGLLRESVQPPFGAIVELCPDNLNRVKWQQHLTGPVSEEIQALQKEIAALEIKEVEHNSAASKLSDFYVPD